MNIFQKFRASLRLREAIQMAERARKENNTRYYVMPSFGSGKARLLVVDRKNFRLLKAKHYIRRDATMSDLIRECFYCTAHPDGNGYLLPADAHKKRLRYFAWCEAERQRARRRLKK